MTLDDLELTNKEFEEKYKKDKRSMRCVARQEGALMAVDFWCLRYINLPVNIRYVLLFRVLQFWGNSKIARWLDSKIKKA